MSISPSSRIDLPGFFCIVQRSILVEFFNSDLFKDFTDALIREDLQNRLDAKRDDVAANEPVIVTYHLSTHDSQAAAKIGKWLAPLEKHCNSKSCRETYHRPLLSCFSGAGQELRYLTIECFNTTGLRGDPEVKTFCEHHQMIAATGAGEESAE